MNIQWYPGHMAKSRRLMEESLSLVDVVIELLDARIPHSSRNPDINALAGSKKRIVVLNKSDLADPAITKKWEELIETEGYRVISVNSHLSKGINGISDIARSLMQEKIESQKKRGRIFVPIRAMIVGIPNVGKSTLINKYVGKALTKTADRPGVTRNKQWVRIKKDFELLDTPGILWPKFDDKSVGVKLALTGAISDDIMDMQSLSIELIKLLLQFKPDALHNRYGVEFDEKTEPRDILQRIGEARGFIMKGGQIDMERSAIVLLDEFRGGKLGRISLEIPEDIQPSSPSASD